MDRKARIRQYKETPRPMGVYRVRNTANGKFLIGSSVDLPAILNRQRFQLELGSHPNRRLQEDWNEFGPEVFEFETLDTLESPDKPDYDPSEDLRVLEDMWLQKLSLSHEPGYNG
ncbi:MAG: GIY-YIG nuclease family protein [Pseudomonadota bacterium]